ncbi:hypothetical protein LTR40_006936, partial [Exophiala xenobiotica]
GIKVVPLKAIKTDFPKAIKVDLPKAIKVDLPKAIKVDLPKAIKVDLPKAIKVDLSKAIKVDLPKAIKVDLPKAIKAISTKEAQVSKIMDRVNIRDRTFTKERHNRTHILEARHRKLNIRIKGHHSLFEENLC